MRGLIIGGGVTGLAAGLASGFEIFEAGDAPGGICSSYYVSLAGGHRSHRRPAGACYRFEVGGGHWIFGGDQAALGLITSLVSVRAYQRRSSVYFRSRRQFVEYPLQHHFDSLDPETAGRIRSELERCRPAGGTLKEWLANNFGPTLCELFFFPFHERYIGPICDRIVPQDAYKSPSNPAPEKAAAGKDAGYNVSYLYPDEGLDELARRMADRCRVRYGKQVVTIDLERREVVTADGQSTRYDALISTAPLNATLDLAGLQTTAPCDPYTSVLVLNIGAVKGPECPDDHWIYTPDSEAGFHRVGFYTNVDAAFGPEAADAGAPRVGLYVERSFPGGQRPSDAAVATYASAVVTELKTWRFIADVDVVDPTWIPVAYTWSWVGSNWKDEATRLLADRGVQTVGRYAGWRFQGIADSIRDGLAAGSDARARTRSST